MSTFNVLLQVCALAPRDASYLLSVPPRIIHRWQRGEAEPPVEVFAKLNELQTRQQEVADAIIASWDEAGRPPAMSIAIASDDEKAREMGWPCRSAQIAPAAIAQAVLGAIKIHLDEEEPKEVDPAAIAAE